MTEVLTPDATMAGDATMVGGVDASEGDARHYHGRRWWRKVKVRPEEGVAVVVGGVDADEGDARRRDDGGEEEDR